MSDLALWPTVIAGTIVSVCATLVTGMVKKGVTLLGDVATKTFVSSEIQRHGDQMKAMFVEDRFQRIVNNDIEFRVRRIEASTGVDVTRPPILPDQR